VEFIVILFFFGLSAGVIGKIKGSSFWLWFLVGFVLPVAGTLAALLYRFERDEARRACPECGTVLPLHDQVCMNCGRDLEWPGDEARVTPA
jgi:ribosomal protein S27AE